MVAIICLSLAGFVIVIGPSQIRRDLIIRNESSVTLTVKRAAYVPYNQKAESIDELGEQLLGTDLVLVPKSEIRLRVRGTELGLSKIALADGRTLAFSMSFGWGQSDVFTYGGVSLGYSGQESILRRLASTAALKLPILNRLLY